MSRITRALLALALLALAAPASAAADPTLVPVGSFNTPMFVASPPGDASRLFVVERSGVIRLVRDGKTLPAPVLDISADVNVDGERGLLSMAFAPDYATSGKFYVYFVAEPDGRLQVSEYRRSAANPDVADPASGRRVWYANHPGATNHNGGTIAFGRDGYLWLATGDGADAVNAQTPSSLLGKVLRIDPRGDAPDEYTVPPGGVYGNGVWATGLRNPFRFSFDRVTGDLVIGDVGDGAHEEVDFVRWPGLGRAANFGWPCREGFADHAGTCAAGPLTDPVIDFPAPRVHRAHRRRRGARPRPPHARRPLPLRRLLRGRHPLAGARAAARDRRPPDGDREGAEPRRVRRGRLRPRLRRLEQRRGLPHPGRRAGPVRAGLRRRPRCRRPPRLATVLPDHTSPRVNIRVARKGRVGRRATPRILLTATENCRVTIRARLAKTNLKRVRTPLRGGRRTIVRLRPKAKAIKKIHRALRRHKRVTMTVRLTAVDAAGNTGHVTKRLKVRRG